MLYLSTKYFTRKNKHPNGSKIGKIVENKNTSVNMAILKDC